VGHPALRAGAPYDLIFANILARPLMRLAPSIASVAAPGADVILSGLQARDVPGVLAAYRAQGLHLAARRDLEGWASLHLRHGGASPRKAL
jgi:ribosomal protein L11 methyltransferase